MDNTAIFVASAGLVVLVDSCRRAYRRGVAEGQRRTPPPPEPVTIVHYLPAEPGGVATAAPEALSDAQRTVAEDLVAMGMPREMVERAVRGSRSSDPAEVKTHALGELIA